MPKKVIKKKEGYEPGEAIEYIYNKLEMKRGKSREHVPRNKIPKGVASKIQNYLMKKQAISLHDKLNITGYSKEDVEEVSEILADVLINKMNDHAEGQYVPTAKTLKDFRTKSYAFNQVYDSNGKPWQYTKIVKYMDENTFAEPIELIVAAKEGLPDHEFHKLDINFIIDKYLALKRYSAVLYNLYKNGILRMVMGEVVQGKNFDIYMEYVKEVEDKLKSDGIELKEN